MEIIDSNGRIGVVIEDRGDVLFAIPLGTKDTIDVAHPGVGRAKYMTATAWHKQLDGSYRGGWYDAPLGTPFASATMHGDVRDRLARAGALLYGERWQSELARALGVGDRRVREWVSGDRMPPAGIWADIAGLLRQRLADGATLLRELDGST